MKPKNREYRRQQFRYAYAYILAAALTIAVYTVTVGGPFDGSIFVSVVLFAAAIQVYVQSRYFLHLDDKETPRWRLMSYAFTWLTLLIIAVGSVWIMGHINYNMGMSPTQVNKYMEDQSLRGY